MDAARKEAKFVVADEPLHQEVKAYLVGGAVRDELLASRSRSVTGS